MRNAKKTLSLVMIAIFTTFIVLSGLPVSAKSVDPAAKAQLSKATYYVVKAESVVSTYSVSVAKNQYAVAVKEVRALKAFGKSVATSYASLSARLVAVNKTIAARSVVVVTPTPEPVVNEDLVAAQKLVDKAEELTNTDTYDLVSSETDLANAQNAVTDALEGIVKLDKDSTDYKGLMARVDAANAKIISAMDQIQVLADQDAQAKAVVAAEDAVKALETAVTAWAANPNVTDAAIAEGTKLQTAAVAAVAAVEDSATVKGFNDRLDVVAKAVKAAIAPAVPVTVSAVDGTITVTFDKAPKTAALADFAVTKTVTTDSAVTSTVVPTAITTNGAVVTLAVPAIAQTDVAQSVVYNVTYATVAKTAAAYTVNKIPDPTVAALNLKQVKITFAKAVDATEGAKLANYFIGADSTTNLADGAGATIALAADNMSAVITLENGASLANSSTTNYVKVLKAVGLSADYTNAALAASDSMIPSVASVKQSGPNSIDIVFSEPLDRGVTAANTVASLTLDAGAMALDPTSAVYVDATNTLTVKTYATLSAGQHTITVKAPASSFLADYAGYKVLATSMAFTYAADATLPTVTVLSNTETTVTLKFNKVVTNVNNANVLFRHTYNSTAYQVTGAAGATNPSGDGMTWIVDFTTARPFVPGASSLFISYSDTSGTLITDSYGNSFAAATLGLNTAVDTVKPTISSVVFTNATTLTVTFSEAVEAASAQTAANYTLKDSAGTAVAVTNAVLDGTKKIVTLTTAAMNGGAYTLVTKAVKDASIAGNIMSDASNTIAVTDTIAPTVVDKVAGGAINVNMLSSTKAMVEFSEAMDPATTGNKANWMYNGAPLATDDTVVLASDNKSAIITIAAGITAPNPFTLGHVKDAAGNYIASFATTLVTVAVAPIAPTSITTTGKNTIVLAFDQLITGATTNDFKVKIGAGAYAFPTAIAVAVVDGKTNITLSTADITNTDGSTVKVETYDLLGAAAGQTNGAVNGYGTKVLIAANTVPVDKYVPALDTTTQPIALDVDGNGQIDHIKFTFSEAMQAGLISADKFTVTGYTVTDAYASTAAPTVATDRTSAVIANSADVYVRVTESGTNDFATKPTVTVATGLKDVAGNAYAGLATATASH